MKSQSKVLLSNHAYFRETLLVAPGCLGQRPGDKDAEAGYLEAVHKANERIDKDGNVMPRDKKLPQKARHIYLDLSGIAINEELLEKISRHILLVDERWCAEFASRYNMTVYSNHSVDKRHLFWPSTSFIHAMDD